jgi:Fanconi anemia group M protein
MKIIYTKPILDIFSKPKKRKIKKEIPKQKIIIDYREKNSLVITELKKLNLEIEIRELKVADYLVNNIAIERKTISDFLSSMINKRLIRQLEEIQQYENKLLIIEGFDKQELYNEENGTGIHSNAIRGFLLSIILKYKVPIIFSKDCEDTAKFINVLARKKEIESSLNVTKKTLNKKERLQFILESFPGIGPKNAKKLLTEFKTLQNIINASQESLQEIIGKKAEVFKIIEENY